MWSRISKLQYLTSIISPTAFVALLLPTFTVNRPLRPDGFRRRSAEDFHLPRRQHRLFGANVRLAALLGYGSELSMFGAMCPGPRDAARIPAAQYSVDLPWPM